MKKIVIRPFNAMSALMLILGLFMLVFSLLFVSYTIIFEPWRLLSIDSLAITLGSLGFGYMGIYFCAIVFKQKIVITLDKIKIHSWLHGTPFDDKGSLLDNLKLPKIKITEIDINDIVEYGNKTNSDIKEILGNAVTRKATTFLTIHFVDKERCGVVFNGDLYKQSQLEYLLFEIRSRIGIEPTGSIEPKDNGNSYFLDILKSFCTLFLIICLTVGLPVLALLIADQTYDSALRIICFLGYFLFSMLAGLFLLMYLSTFSYGLKKDESYKSLRKFSKIVFIVLYSVAVISFLLSVFNVV
jgi:hypothetical protein